MILITGLLKKVFGTKHDRDIRKMTPIVEKINKLESSIAPLTDDALKSKTVEFKSRISKGESLDSILPEAFAVVREAGKRVLGMRHFDVQLMGGMVLHSGQIAEMKTGEGKTLVATLPCYLNALSGKGVHVVTVNDYLASRDAEWMGRIHRFLGLSVGCITRDLSNEERRNAYASDITYGTNSEMGFDYLRDNMKMKIEDFVQRGHNFAIVDEVDSILIDEARTPLIISGQAEGDVDLYSRVDKIVPQLQADIDYTVDTKSRSVSLTDEGINRVEERLSIRNLFNSESIETLHGINQALRAHALYRRDVEYVVRDNKVIIVDEFTGRLMPGRRWSDGLHQAIEAKEKVTIEAENRTVATITYQNFFLLYGKLAGMTGTADTEAAEFQKIYKLDTVVVPTNTPARREDFPDFVYKTELEKVNAIVKEIEAYYKNGRPVLVGTVSVEKSEIISRMLTKKDILHNVLNAKNHAREAEIIAQAGHSGMVTIATNMAGRGTDILLGGNAEYRTRSKIGKGTPVDDPEYISAYKEAVQECEADKKKVLSLGGLHIIGTERHDSRRIDNQLRGRAGRQGDPGSSKFFLSLEDSLMKAFGSDKIAGMMDRFGYEEDTPIEHPWLSKSIQGAQSKLEGYHFGMRKALKEYDDVLNQQRQVFYKIRTQILQGKGTKEIVLGAVEYLVYDIIDTTCPERLGVDEWNYDLLKEKFALMFANTPEIDMDKLHNSQHPREDLESILISKGKELYQERELDLTPDLLRRAETEILLRTMDRLWMDHLSAIDHLRDSVRLRGIGQRDPLLEYKREGYEMFQQMLGLRDEQIVEQLFRVRKITQEEILKMEAQRKMASKLMEQGGGTLPHSSPIDEDDGIENENVEASQKEQKELPGKNDPCWCGSGKKYKKCHQANDDMERRKMESQTA